MNRQLIIFLFQASRSSGGRYNRGYNNNDEYGSRGGYKSHNQDYNQGYQGNEGGYDYSQQQYNQYYAQYGYDQSQYGQSGQDSSNGKFIFLQCFM
jgi:hypothetical protein